MSWKWRVVTMALSAIVLAPASVLYLVDLTTVQDVRLAYYGPGIPMLPPLVSGALGLTFTTWGLASLWWLTVRNEALSLRRIGYGWWPGIVGGALVLILRLIELLQSPDADAKILIPPAVAVLLVEVVLLIRIALNENG